ncbi:MAG: transglutaminase-like domain-containing protein, partial [Bryobacteraceae bacterium]
MSKVTLDALRAALRNDSSVTLDVAALELAALESPAIDPRPYLDSLDQIASGLAARGGDVARGPEFLSIANSYLFGDLGFRGAETEYYDPRNSCLNQVLDRRTGIPITLSVVYLEVARRLGRPVFGIGLPGHFVVEYDDGEFSTYIDPFHAGKLLDREECSRVAREITGVDLVAEPSALERVGTRYILVRMLNNLRSAYFRVKQYAKACAALDLLVEAFPANGEYYKARGVARLQLRDFSAARKDLESYLQRSPEATDR